MNDSNKKKFEGLVDTCFEMSLLNAIFTNLEATDNKLRFNNFAYSLRELSRHILHRLAPDENVLSCAWYSSPDPHLPSLITRNHRMTYAIQGGFQENYLMKHFELDFSKSKRRTIDSIEFLNKFTHINVNVFDLSQKEIDVHVNEISDAFLNLFDEIQHCRKQLLNLIDDEIDNELLAHVIYETNPEVDLMSTHHYIEAIVVTSIHVNHISDESIFFQADGEIFVEQQFGSDTDVANDIGGIIHTSFPFQSKLASRIHLLPQIENNLEIISFQVDVYGDPTDEEIEKMEQEHMKELGLDINKRKDEPKQ